MRVACKEGHLIRKAVKLGNGPGKRAKYKAKATKLKTWIKPIPHSEKNGNGVDDFN